MKGERGRVYRRAEALRVVRGAGHGGESSRGGRRTGGSKSCGTSDKDNGCPTAPCSRRRERRGDRDERSGCDGAWAARAKAAPVGARGRAALGLGAGYFKLRQGFPTTPSLLARLRTPRRPSLTRVATATRVDPPPTFRPTPAPHPPQRASTGAHSRVHVHPGLRKGALLSRSRASELPNGVHTPRHRDSALKNQSANARHALRELPRGPIPREGTFLVLPCAPNAPRRPIFCSRRGTERGRRAFRKVALLALLALHAFPPSRLHARDAPRGLLPRSPEAPATARPSRAPPRRARP